ncbi:hypothetical protein T4E_10368 [Trichinella pseudospiralis]|uniref:PiggyBac transposable element-derived protein domain-containing protein n=1 Tax=Trichinella pseudospiralis TaxID=6337 RepID=A0A0V0YKP8_TRIPS|nr:hypothetical protein T4E_10368 [Trichinella pseudospiralis]
MDSLWNTENRRHILPSVMSMNNFQRISRIIRFDDRKTTLHCRKKDSLAAIRDMWDDCVACLPMMCNPGAYVTADKRLIPFKGSGSFQQYMLKSQQRKRTSGIREKNQGMHVVLNLTAGLKKNNVTCENFFTSHKLAMQLLKRKLMILSTIKKNKTQEHKNYWNSMYKDAPFSTGRDCKPEMILDYNATKRASNNGYLLWAHCNPECDVNKMYRRRLHLEKLEKAPLTPQIHRRKRLPGPLTATYFAPNVQIEEQGTSKSTIKQKAFRM